jgi:hypothetical protein
MQTMPRLNPPSHQEVSVACSLPHLKFLIAFVCALPTSPACSLVQSTTHNSPVSLIADREPDRDH